MRRELVVPFQFAGLNIQRDHGIRVEVVAFALISIVIRTGIPHLPIQQLQFRIVRTGEPGSSPGMRNAFSVPRFRSGFSCGGDGPETPGLLARPLIESGEKSPNAAIAAPNPRNHEIPGDQRCRCRKVVLAIVRHHRIPKQFAGESIERDQRARHR